LWRQAATCGCTIVRARRRATGRCGRATASVDGRLSASSTGRGRRRSATLRMHHAPPSRRRRSASSSFRQHCDHRSLSILALLSAVLVFYTSSYLTAAVTHVLYSFFTARCYAECSRPIAIVCCLSVRPSGRNL